MVKEVLREGSEAAPVEHLRAGPAECRMVDADEFCAMLVSTRTFRRDDGKEFGCRALMDPETGERFVVEEHKLHAALRRE